jgi:hypothetical protein
MKALRVFLWGGGILLVLVAVAIAVALSSSLQTWAARRALAARPDVRGTIGAVSAGLGRVDVSSARIESRGAVLTLPSLRVDLPLATAGLRRRVIVERLVAKGWTLDLTHATGLAAAARSGHAATRPVGGFPLISSAQAADPAPAVAAAFQGIFATVALPVDLSVDGVDLAGEVILPPIGGQGAARLQVTVTGGGLGVGGQGSFVVDVAGSQADGSSLTLHATLAATMDTPRTFTRLGAKASAAASATQFPQGVRLNIDAAAERTPAGERYAGVLSAANKDLAVLKGEMTAAASRITGSWKIDLRDADVLPFLLGKKLPVFAARGEGAFETGTALKEIHVSGQLNASGERLDVLRAELGAIGAIQLAAQFDLWQHGTSVRVERLDAAVTGASPIASVKALQPFEFNLATAELGVADPAKDLIGIALTGVPLAWAQPFLGNLTLSGGDLHGDFAASARDGGLALRARTPLTIGALSVSRGGEPVLQDVDIALNASADYTPRGWQAEIVELGVRSHSVLLLRFDAKAGQLSGADPAVKATGHWQANLPGWAGQPVLAQQVQLASGTAHGEFAASVDGRRAIEAKIVITDVVAATKEKLPNLATELRADMAPDGKITFKAPFTFDQGGRKSDLLLAGTIIPGTTANQLDARLSGNQIFVEDVKLLGLLASGGSQPAKPVSAPEQPGQPFWSKWTGQVVLALKKVVYGESFEVADVAGTLRLDPTALNLEGVRAAFGADSDVKLSGGVKFNGHEKQAYAVGLDVALNNFDTGAAFRAIDPAKLPTIEGRVNVTSHVTGSGGNVAEAAERARGDLQVTGRSGVFRALSADVTDKVQKTQSTVAALGGLIGAVTGKKEYIDYAEKTQILTDIAKALAEIPFDQLNVTAQRDAGLNVTLKDFTLISPEIRLTGGGGIRYVEAKSLLEQPLQLELQLGARGRLGDLLKRAGLLETKADNLGYAALTNPIRITGSLAKTDTGDLVKTLLNSTLFK